MRISEQLARLNVIKDALRDAITAKGVLISEDEPFSAYASGIARIQGGGGIPNPIFDPAPGRYQGFVTVSLSAAAGDIYFFAEDAQDPAGAAPYTQPIGIDTSRTITAFAYDRDTKDFSRAITARYDITGYLYAEFLEPGVMLAEEVLITVRPETILRVEDILDAGNNITEAVE